MARKVKTEQVKKKSRFKIIMIILIIILLAGIAFLGYKLWPREEKTKEPAPVKILDSIDDYGYSLSERDSKYYKSEYENLKKILNANPVDENAYVTQIAKMFTIDLYTLSTKVNKYDVGGMEFFHSKKRDMFEQKVIDTLYSTLLDDTYGDRKQELPEVSNVEVISTTKTTYKLGETSTEGYLVKLNITYVKDMGYDKEASIVLCKDEGKKWNVVDFQPTLNPKY